MKKSRLVLITLFLLFGLTLSACSGAFSASSWPGVSANPEGDTVYVAFNQKVFAVQASSGTLRWSFPETTNAAQTFYAPPALTGNGQVIVTGYDKAVHGVNTETGKEVWAFKGAANRFIGSALATEEVVYAPSVDEKLYAFDYNGTAMWQTPFKAAQALWAAPAISADGSTLYLTSMDRNLYALSAEDGSVIWQQDLGGASAGTPTLDEAGNLYIGTFSSELLALNRRSGEIMWRLPVNGWVWTAPLYLDGVLYFGDLEGFFYAVQDGEILWSIQPDGPITGSALHMDGTLYFGTETGSLYAIDLDGEILWTRSAGGKLYGTPQQAGDLIIVAPIEADTLLVAYDQTGTQAWTFTPPQ